MIISSMLSIHIYETSIPKELMFRGFGDACRRKASAGSTMSYY